jgi:hypothetical protein
MIGLEVVQPVDQLLIQGLCGGHLLLAVAVVAAGGALVAARLRAPFAFSHEASVRSDSWPVA